LSPKTPKNTSFLWELILTQRNCVCIFGRLNASPTAKVAKSIVFLLTLYKAAPPGTWSDQIPGAEDSVSKSILTVLAPHVLERYTPRATVGDGNCCFRAVSLALYNTEEHHGYVRLLAACEMIQHAEFYDVSAPSSLLKDDRIVSPRVAEALSSVTVEGTYVDLIHIFAISSALDVTIQSYTPPTNVCGLETSPYTRLIAGRAVWQAKAPAMTLMWTATTVPRKGQPFTPNHIVLLVERPAGSRIIDVDDSTATFDYEAAGGADVSTCEQDHNDASLVTTEAEISNSDCAQLSADDNSDNDTATG